MTTKECGSCSLCCKFLDVPDMAPGMVWCPHAKPGSSKGCAIYEDRPENCLGFDCFWKAEGWPDELRPDRCWVMFEALPGVVTILATVEPSRPEAWKKKLVSDTIRKLVSKGRPVIIYIKGQKPLYAIPKGKTRQEVMDDVEKVRHGCAKLHA